MRNYSKILSTLYGAFPGHSFHIEEGDKMPDLIMDGERLPVVFRPDDGLMNALDLSAANNPGLTVSQIFIKYLIDQVKENVPGL